jgi:DNA-directed RNA polymerase subunit RPC12/RpoP
MGLDSIPPRDLAVVIGIVALFLFVRVVLPTVFDRKRCPKCGKKGAAEVQKAQRISVSWSISVDRDSPMYKVHYKCKECGHIWDKDKNTPF